MEDVWQYVPAYAIWPWGANQTLVEQESVKVDG